MVCEDKFIIFVWFNGVMIILKEIVFVFVVVLFRLRLVILFRLRVVMLGLGDDDMVLCDE